MSSLDLDGNKREPVVDISIFVALRPKLSITCLSIFVHMLKRALDNIEHDVEEVKPIKCAAIEREMLSPFPFVIQQEKNK